MVWESSDIHVDPGKEGAIFIAVSVSAKLKGRFKFPHRPAAFFPGLVQEQKSKMAEARAEFWAIQERVWSSAERAAAGQWSVPELQPVQQLDNQGRQPAQLQGLPLGTQLHEPPLQRDDVTTHVLLVSRK